MTGHKSDQGNWLAEAREAAGISVLELAIRSDISTRTIERLETTSQRPHPGTLRLLATALGMDPADLYEREAA